MRKKKFKINQGSVLSETYVPASLPAHGLGLDGFVASDYTVNSDAALQQYYKDFDANLGGVLASCDKFTSGNVLDGQVDGQIAHLYCFHQGEAAQRKLQAKRINAERQTRMEELRRRMDSLSEGIRTREESIAPLKDLHPQFELTLGRLRLSYGPIVTVAAMAVDALLNFSFLQGVLLQSLPLLIITVVCMSVMSDGSMFCLGTLLSRKEEKFLPTWLFYLLTVGLSCLFLLSVVAGVMVRFGSMDVTYGTINAAGQFVGKDTYTAAEWGVSLVTAFLTTCTGLISLGFSVDKNAHLVARRRKWEAEKAAMEAEYEPLVTEYSALEKAVDAALLDEAREQAACGNIEALRNGLKLHARKRIAELSGDPEVTETMARSAEELTKGSTTAAALSLHPVGEIRTAV